MIRQGARITSVLAILVVAGPLAWVPPAAADAGAGIEASPVVLATPAHPGNSYTLPAVYVVNTGTDVSQYHLKVEDLSLGKGGHSVPPDWVHFSRNDFVLAPKESTTVPMRLNVESGAQIGNYASDLVVGTVPRSGHGLNAVASAQAATKLLFTVRLGVNDDSSWLWWLLLSMVVAGVLLAVSGLQRRHGFRLRIERRH
jgi:hypothetical protein